MISKCYWERRRDLEGGKQLGIWLLKDGDGVVEKELIVETHEYRGGVFDVHEVVDAEWKKLGDFDTASAAFSKVEQVLAVSDFKIATKSY